MSSAIVEVSPTLASFLERAYSNMDESHDLKHAYKVWDNALHIIQAQGWNLSTQQQQILPYVILCHDVFDHKYADKGLTLSKSEIDAFYVEQLGQELANVVIYIHNNCSWSKRMQSSPVDNAEFEQLRLLLQDADWLEAIGEVGLDRCIAYATAFNNPIPASVCEHIHEKLLKISAELNFDSSRKMASTRNQPLMDYLALHDVTSHE